MQLSILICSLYSRIEKRLELIKLLRHSIGPNQVTGAAMDNYTLQRYTSAEAEVVVITDAKQMSVGAKRNLLISEAKGAYVCFIDDDDMVMYSYVQKLLEATAAGTDVIVFDAMRYENDKPDRRVSYGKEYLYDYSNRQLHYRLPNHLMCFKRTLATRVKFPEISFGEDSAWARAMLPYINTQHRIYETLYEYWFDSQTTETQ